MANLLWYQQGYRTARGSAAHCTVNERISGFLRAVAAVCSAIISLHQLLRMAAAMNECFGRGGFGRAIYAWGRPREGSLQIIFYLTRHRLSTRNTSG